MFRKDRKILTTAIVLLVLLVPLGSAEAAGRGRPGGVDLWSQLLGWARALWTEGSSIDPFGRAQNTVQSDDSSQIDPFGHTQGTVHWEDSSSIDPNGSH